MSKKHKLNLKQNAFDSLHESIIYYLQAVENESKYKFCIVLFFNFAELILKYCVETIDPLLCFNKTRTVEIDKNHTIHWVDAIKILKKKGYPISENAKKQLENLSLIRNDIIHFEFEYTTSEIRKLIVEVMKSLSKIFETVTKTDINDFVNVTARCLLNEIRDEYAAELHLAQSNAKEDAEGKEVSDCGFCGSEKTVVFSSEKQFHCFFCEENDEIEECTVCTEEFKISEMFDFGENEFGDKMFFCEFCYDCMKSE